MRLVPPQLTASSNMCECVWPVGADSGEVCRAAAVFLSDRDYSLEIKGMSRKKLVLLY